MRVLIVDDEPSDRLILRKVLAEIGDVEVVEADGLASARVALREESFAAAIIDLRLGEDVRNRDGHLLVRELRETKTVPIVWTATREIPELREAMRNGAYDYIFKDAPHKELVSHVLDGLRSRRVLEREVLEHRARLSLDQPVVHQMVGDSNVMCRLREDVKLVATGSQKPVLILGPSGSGKELVARALHALGPHPDAPFVAKNCAAIPESLFESELFGHEDRAFTGAKRRAGAFGAAGDGSLFLDEVGELPLAQQAKLLRVLETRRYAPVGSDSEKNFRGRVITATLADLEELVQKGRFRRDLYMRLSFFPLRTPGLEEHLEDIPSIIDHYVRTNGIRSLTFSAAAIQDLQARQWAGSVRELQQVVERIALRPPHDGVVLPEHVATALHTTAYPAHDLFSSTARVLLNTLGPKNAEVPDALENSRVNLLEELAATLIREALARSGQKNAKAARLLGINRRVIERFMKREPASSDPWLPVGSEPPPPNETPSTDPPAVQVEATGAPKPPPAA